MQCLFPSLEEAPKVACTRRAQTGGTYSTVKWNAVTRLAFGMVLPHWNELHYGVRAGGKWQTHACYADN
eukprot:214063-Pyramimonas_sp.AAC.1